MLESIHIGMSGLIGYSKGLRVIANNTANLNTPGFKSAKLQFADMFYSGQDDTGGTRLGHGLDAGAATLSFLQGELRQSSNPLDLAIDGLGFFMVRDEGGSMSYTRAGQFSFGTSGQLTERGSNAKILAHTDNGGLEPVSLAGINTIAARPTSVVRLAGNLSSTATLQAVEAIPVIDKLGRQHSLRAVISSTSVTGAANQAGRWTLQLFEAERPIGAQSLVFSDGKPTSASERLSFSYTPDGLDPMPLTLDLGSDVSSFAAGSLSTLAVAGHDGLPPGSLTEAAFDAGGVLRLSYSNGQVIDGPRLALARFESEDDVLAAGGNRFVTANGASWLTGSAGDGAFGTIKPGMLEISNVDLSQEFSDLVIMQRGYQASSQVISTANDMLQELFSMKSAS